MDEGTKPGWREGTHFPPTVGPGKLESSRLGDGVVAASRRVVVEEPMNELGYSHLMLSTRVGSPPQRS